MAESQNSQGASTRSLLAQAAIDHFASNGFDGTSMRELAKAVGITPASLYNYAPSKEELLWEIILCAITDLAEYQTQALEGLENPVDRLRAFVRVHVSFSVQRNREATITNRKMQNLSPDHLESLLAFRNWYEGILRCILKEGDEDGCFDVVDLHTTSYALLHMGNLTSTWFRSDGRLSVEDLCQIHIRLALRIVAADG